MTTKLPKQWLYWAKKARLKPERQRGKDNGYYFFGRSRHWRVNCHGHFECSCPEEHFDRWANSRGAHMAVIPRTEANFLTAVRDLLDASKDAR
jgi:hypothetical protein